MASDNQRNPYVYLSGAFAAVWVFAAWINPDRNYFLFPMLIAASLPIAYRLTTRKPLSMPAALGAATAGLTNVVLVSVLLAISGKLEGEPLVPFGGLVIEALVLGLAGGLVAALIASWGHTRR